MIEKTIKHIFVGVMLILALLLICVLFDNTNCYADALVSNVSANCSIQTVKKGDEVRIEVSTKEMTVSTFIANLEYNPEVMTYKGYEGPDGDQSVYLVDVNDESMRFDVAVEQSKVDPIVGMYAIGTKEKRYSVAEPLVTLIFKAKDNGAVEYNVSEASDGEDAYTSPEMEQNIETKSVNDNHIALYIGCGIVVTLICLAFVIIRKRKGRRNDG